jgi:hypothetical protein
MDEVHESIVFVISKNTKKSVKYIKTSSSVCHLRFFTVGSQTTRRTLFVEQKEWEERFAKITFYSIKCPLISPENRSSTSTFDSVHKKFIGGYATHFLLFIKSAAKIHERMSKNN